MEFLWCPNENVHFAFFVVEWNMNESDEDDGGSLW